MKVAILLQKEAVVNINCNMTYLRVDPGYGKSFRLNKTTDITKASTFRYETAKKLVDALNDLQKNDPGPFRMDNLEKIIPISTENKELKFVYTFKWYDEFLREFVGAEVFDPIGFIDTCINHNLIG